MRPAQASPALLAPDDRAFLEAVAALVYGNPFHPDRALAERAAAGGDFSDTPGESLRRVLARLRPLLASLRDRLGRGAPASGEDLALYHAGCFFFLYGTHEARLQQIITKQITSIGPLLEKFAADHDGLLLYPGAPEAPPAEEVFAACFQVRRAVHFISSTLIGASRPLCNLRRRTWEAIFTVDMREALAGPDAAMDEIPVHVTGPSGTGKDLVARAIGHCRRVAVDPRRGCFASDYEKDFHTLHLMSQAETLIESTLFGHRRGAFTGAVADHAGWFETNGVAGTLFLDEIGTLAHSIQVKLLVVLETRTFQRVGDLADLHFHGRVVSATNEDLAALVAQNAFRLDLYHRLCAVILRTPSLRDQLDDLPSERRRHVRFIAGQIRQGNAGKAEALTDKVERWIDQHLPGYDWPGNVRELGRCVRSVMTVDGFEPSVVKPVKAATDESDPLHAIREGTASEKEILEICTTVVQAKTHDVQATARVLGVHPSTVTRRIDFTLLAKLMGGDPSAALPRKPGRPRRK